MYRITDSPYEYPKLITSIECLLFDTEYNRAKIFVVGEIIPMFRSVKVLLIRFLFDRCQFETLILFPLFLDRRFLFRYVVRLKFSFLGQGKLIVLDFIRIYTIPDTSFVAKISSDLLPRTFDPITRRWYKVVRILLTEFI